jgi:hypothetical protein
MVKFLLLMSNFGHPVEIKYIPSLAFSIGRWWHECIRTVLKHKCRAEKTIPVEAVVLLASNTHYCCKETFS